MGHTWPYMALNPTMVTAMAVEMAMSVALVPTMTTAQAMDMALIVTLATTITVIVWAYMIEVSPAPPPPPILPAVV